MFKYLFFISTSLFIFNTSLAYVPIPISIPNFIEELEDHEVLIPYPSDRASKPLRTIINLLVWNIYKAKRDQLYPDLEYLSGGKDLILLQETVNDPDFFSFTQIINWTYWLTAASFRQSSGFETGVTSGFIQNPINSFFLRSPDREPILNTPKMVLGNIFKIDSHTNLLVLNIHAINFVTNAAHRRQIDQAVEVISQHRGPVIFAGDFNTWNRWRMNYVKSALAEVGLKPAILDGESDISGLDHIFTRQIEVLDFQILSHIRSSDHSPLVASVKIQKP